MWWVEVGHDLVEQSSAQTVRMIAKFAELIDVGQQGVANVDGFVSVSATKMQMSAGNSASGQIDIWRQVATQSDVMRIAPARVKWHIPRCRFDRGQLTIQCFGDHVTFKIDLEKTGCDLVPGLPGPERSVLNLTAGELTTPAIGCAVELLRFSQETVGVWLQSTFMIDEKAFAFHADMAMETRLEVELLKELVGLHDSLREKNTAFHKRAFFFTKIKKTTRLLKAVVPPTQLCGFQFHAPFISCLVFLSIKSPHLSEQLFAGGVGIRSADQAVDLRDRCRA